jgi:hypothetical protein
MLLGRGGAAGKKIEQAAALQPLCDERHVLRRLFCEAEHAYAVGVHDGLHGGDFVDDARALRLRGAAPDNYFDRNMHAIPHCTRHRNSLVFVVLHAAGSSLNVIVVGQAVAVGSLKHNVTIGNEGVRGLPVEMLSAPPLPDAARFAPYCVLLASMGDNER